MLNSEIALDAADGDPDNLQTPLYDAATQSCLTHVFDVLGWWDRRRQEVPLFEINQS
ncbi:hypothetical protein ACOBV9_18530 (plasmid) [Pseudoalteromonas espejiana]